MECYQNHEEKFIFPRFHSQFTKVLLKLNITQCEWYLLKRFYCYFYNYMFCSSGSIVEPRTGKDKNLFLEKRETILLYLHISAGSSMFDPSIFPSQEKLFECMNIIFILPPHFLSSPSIFSYCWTLIRRGFY